MTKGKMLPFAIYKPVFKMDWWYGFSRSIGGEFPYIWASTNLYPGLQ